MKKVVDDYKFYSVIVFIFSILIRWLISLSPHSGKGKPPLFGDYEAQRHWMEITYNLPVKSWYYNTTDNDLLYWGLDYPPLTAYHSLIMGYIANKINPEFVVLHKSRGIETPMHKLFMRYTVIIGDLLIYIPAIFVYFYLKKSISSKVKIANTLLVLLYPGLMLIDHGHFQYNSISLGFVVWAMIFMEKDRNLLGAAFFVLALNYKQMELYHATPFFFYLLGKCFFTKGNWFLHLCKVSIVTAFTFGLCWLPFLQNYKDALQVLHRLFPFARGIFEDKVANFWCSLSILIKFRSFVKQDLQILICLITTGVLLLPSGVHLMLKPTMRNFRLALINSSLIFFLFSFQVHEKSILIAALPILLCLPDYSMASYWFGIISTFSMFPLLQKDGLTYMTFSSALIFTVFYFMILPSISQDERSFSWKKFLMILSITGGCLLIVASSVVKPPKHLPDIHPVLISIFSCGHFILFLTYFYCSQLFGHDKLKTS